MSVPTNVILDILALTDVFSFHIVLKQTKLKEGKYSYCQEKMMTMMMANKSCALVLLACLFAGSHPSSAFVYSSSSSNRSKQQLYRRRRLRDWRYSSVLEGEERDGTYYCAGCRNPLFASDTKVLIVCCTHTKENITTTLLYF